MRSSLALPQVRADFINSALLQKGAQLRKHVLKLEILRLSKASLELSFKT